VARQDLRPWAGIVDVPKFARLQGWLGDSDRLEDSATLNPHRQLLGKVEWVWLKVGSPPIDMAFIDPSLALGASLEFQFGIDEGFRHLPTLSLSPSYRRGRLGNGHGHLMVLTLSRDWERVGKGQIERDFRERVGKGQREAHIVCGKGSGKGQILSVYFPQSLGKGGKGSFERD